jgi:sugar phosphate isomerase/epimerase
MQNVTRRRFLSSTLFSALGVPLLSQVHAIPPIDRRGEPRMKLSLAAYSFRQFFQSASGAAQDAGGRVIDLFEFIDYCADQGCDGTELTSYYFPPDAEDEYLLRLRRHAFLRGIAISGTAVGNTFTLPRGGKRDEEVAHVKRWIDRAALMGAPHIRIFAGNQQSGMSEAEAKSNCIEAIRDCCEYAGQKGVFLGLENHGGIVAEADALLEIVRAVESPWFGVNLDTGNFHTEDPYQDLARCAPYAVNVQVKVEIQARDQPKTAADLGRLIGILRECRYQGFVALEYEAEEDAWVAVPRALRELKALMAA